MDGFHVDPAALERAAGDLDEIGTQVDRLADSIPPTTDLGPGAPEIAAILAKVTSEAGTFVIGLRAAAGNVRTSLDNYLAADATTQQQLPRVGGD